MFQKLISGGDDYSVLESTIFSLAHLKHPPGHHATGVRSYGFK